MDFIRSRYSLENASKIINEKYDLGEIIQAEKLGGIANDNYKIEFANESVALKVYSHGQSNKDKINKEIEAVKIFRDAGIHALDFVPGKDGKILQEYEGFNVVLTKFIDGPVLDSLQFTPELMFEVGKIVATIDKTAKNIDVSKFECMNFS